jgi:hypothetical protein
MLTNERLAVWGTRPGATDVRQGRQSYGWAGGVMSGTGHGSIRATIAQW